MLDLIAGTLYLFLIALITYHAGVLIWEERDSNNDEVQDALPNPEWPAFAAKFVALLSSIAIILASGDGGGDAGAVLPSLSPLPDRPVHRDLVWHRLQRCSSFWPCWRFSFMCSRPTSTSATSPSSAFASSISFIWRPLHVATYLVQFGQAPTMVYSDFFGYAPFLQRWAWFTLYWTAFCVFLVVATMLLWPRGRDRVGAAGSGMRACAINGPLRFIAAVGLIGFVATGGWIYYNTKVLNTVRSENDSDALQADYEKTYKKFEKQPEPRVTDVKYAIDLYPESREHGPCAASRPS